MTIGVCSIVAKNLPNFEPPPKYKVYTDTNLYAEYYSTSTKKGQV